MRVYVIVRNCRTGYEWAPQLLDCSEFGDPHDPRQACQSYLDMLGPGYKIVDIWPTSQSEDEYKEWLKSQKERKR